MAAAWAGARRACVRPSHGAQPSSLIDADARIGAATRHSSDIAAALRLLIESPLLLFDAFSTIHFREVLMFRMQSAFPNVVPRLG
ncbi:hypothetical protein WK11_09955 [Burkholderia ubonensis]|nr:hypothetical protein WK11_09955 [Burkholderia ubonensis]